LTENILKEIIILELLNKFLRFEMHLKISQNPIRAN